MAYICSATAPIELIRKNVNRIAEYFGDSVFLDGEIGFSFPKASVLAKASLSELEEVMVGLPVLPSRISRATQRTVAGELDFEALKSMPYRDCKNELMERQSSKKKVPNGIGDKIADCILLFSLEKLEAFPIDTHIRSAVLSSYFPGQKQPTDHQLRLWAQNRFGRYAGYAGQFLFHDMRQVPGA